MDGVAATKQVPAQFPQVKMLIFTTFNDRDYVQKALRAGASGYLLKDTPFDELTQAIRLVLKGYSQIEPRLLDCPRNFEASASGVGAFNRKGSRNCGVGSTGLK